MRKLKLSTLFLLLNLWAANCNAQEPGVPKRSFKEKIRYTPWVVGHGWNVVHDDAGKWFRNLFKTNDVWNITPYPLRFTCEKWLYDKDDNVGKTRGWSVEFIGAYNRYGVGNYLVDQGNPILVITPYKLFSFDLHAKYNFNKLVDLNKLFGAKQEVFQPYGTFGLGYTYRTLPAHPHSATINAGLGFNVWIYKGIGIQLQSLAKFGLKDKFPNSGSNYLQHSVGVVYQFALKPTADGSTYAGRFREKMKRTPWVIGYGWNIVHDDGGKWFKNLFNTDKTWNMAPYPIRFSLEKYLYADSSSKKGGWSVELMAAYNRYGIGNYLSDREPQVLVPVHYKLFSVDLHAKYNFNKLVDINKLFGAKKEIFQPYGTFGLGYTYRTLPTHPHTATLNGGLGFNIWMYKGLGIQVQSIAKFGLEDKFPIAGSNYLQHSFGLVYKLGIRSEEKRTEFREKMKTTPWVVGHGWNIVHDDAGKWFKNLFNADKVWNMTPYPLRFTAEKWLYSKEDSTKGSRRGWSVELMAAYNRYGSGNYLVDRGGNPVLVTTQYNLLSFDLHAKYNFNRLVNINKWFGSEKEIFQPYGTFGLGYTYRDLPAHPHTPTLNAGLGFNVWIYKGIGVQVQSIAKFGMKDKFPHSGSNYLQHSISVVYMLERKSTFGSNRYKFRKNYIKKVL